MKKVVIIGPSGAGKSEFARKLNKIIKLPLYPLDNIWWKEDKSHITREEFDFKLAKIIKQDSWIIEGDYSRTYEVRMDAADTIFFLNYPLKVCLSGVEGRIGKKRSDIPWVEEEFDPEFKEWICNWFINTLPRAMELLDKYKQIKNVIVFHSREEANLYLEEFEKK